MTTKASLPQTEGPVVQHESDLITADGELLVRENVEQIPGDVVALAPFLRSGFNYDRDYASRASGLLCQDPSLTQQQFAEDADINTIVRRFGITGELPTGVRAPSYGDFTGVSDFRSALAAIDAAEASFMALPAHVRATFQNDPGLFVDYCSDPANAAGMKELGLLSSVPTPAPVAPPGPDPVVQPSPVPTPT